jgi:16S rRNA (cytosine967-C5)-methyltransferase
MEPDVVGLPPRDAAFCHAIYDNVLRHWITLEFILDRFLSTPIRDLEPNMQAVLLVGAAQIVAMDAVPPHAAVDEAVRWAKATIRPGAGGLANAVLRKISEAAPRVTAQDGRSIPLTRAAWSMGDDEFPLASGRCRVLRGVTLPADTTSRLAVATSHPKGLIEAWSSRYGGDPARAIAHHNVGEAPTVVNASYLPAELANSLSPSPALSPHAEPGHFVWSGHESALSEFLAAQPGAWVQDSSSSQAVRSIAERRPERIVDLCAGRGTKTRQLRAAFPGARIIATDTDDARRSVLQATFRGDPSVMVCAYAEALDLARAAADLVLIDVPCSNTGVLARRLEAKYRASAAQTGRLIEIQREILVQASALLGPSGAILYATCSIERSENQDQASWAVAQLGLQASRERSSLPSGLPGEATSGYRDGSYSVLLARTSGPR